MRARSTRRSGGGSATVAGTDYQSRVAAWIAVQILGEVRVSLPWSLPAAITLDFVQCEADEPVDDLITGTLSQDYLVFIQAKHTLALQTTDDSDLGKSIDQFVRQYLKNLNLLAQRRGARALTPTHDRLVITTSSRSPATIRQHLREVLDKVRVLAPGVSLAGVASNNGETDALNVICDHLQRAWTNETTETLTTATQIELLSLMWIQELDVDVNGRDEIAAKATLRAILADPAQVESAWASLIGKVVQLARAHGGVNRTALQRTLQDGGIELQATPSYRTDVQKLRESTMHMHQAIARHAIIPLPHGQVKINRSSVTAIRTVAESDSLLVIGEPGSGKSGVLYDLVSALLRDQRDVVFLVADRLRVHSRRDLRQELQLNHDLVQILSNWPGSAPAFLIIDALDAARDEETSQFLLDLIADVKGTGDRWRVVASVRKYDLRHNQALKREFRGQSLTTLQDSEFATVRHINVPVLSNEELDQVVAQSADLAVLLQQASPALLNLVRIPFNLWLLGDLLLGGTVASELSPIRTQFDLLQQYWRERIGRYSSQGDAREAVLRQVVEAMIHSRTLYVSMSEIQRPDTNVALSNLLKDEILVEWQQEASVLTFNHHILFDYAVARLVFRGTSIAFIDRIKTEPDLVLALVPSFVFHFQDLWLRDTDRSPFWSFIFEVAEATGLPELTRVIALGVVAEMATSVEEIEVLLSWWQSGTQEARTIAETSIKHLVGALLASDDPFTALVGNGKSVWIACLERMSLSMSPQIAYMIRDLLQPLSAKFNALTVEQQVVVGAVARRLLDFVWALDRRSRYLIRGALTLVCKTIESDPSASGTLLRRALEPVHLATFGYEELFPIVHQLPILLHNDLALVEDLYRAAFSYLETNASQTTMSDSQLMALFSTKKQDYGQVLYGLAGQFPAFMERAPLRAVRVAIAAINFHLLQEEVERWKPRKIAIPTARFAFAGKQAHFRCTTSYLPEENVRGLLKAFEAYVNDLGQDQNRKAERASVYEILATDNTCSLLWQRLLEFGVRYPDTIGLEVQALALTPIVHTCHTTMGLVRSFILSIYPLLSEETRRAIEMLILDLPKYVDGNAWAERNIANHQQEIFSLLPLEFLTTDAARQMRVPIPSEPTPSLGEEVPSNDPPSLSREDVLNQNLVDQEVLVEDDRNHGVLKWIDNLETFWRTHLNTTPSEAAVQQIAPTVFDIYAMLQSADVDAMEPRFQLMAYEVLIKVCERLTQDSSILCDTPLGILIRNVLMEATGFRTPERGNPLSDSTNTTDEDTLEFRYEATQGLMRLAGRPTCLGSDLVDIIDRLSHDENPHVRAAVAKHLVGLYSIAPELMWKLVNRLAEDTEVDPLWDLTTSLFSLTAYHSDQVATLTEAIYHRTKGYSHMDPVRSNSTDIFLRLYLHFNNSVARQVLFGMGDAPEPAPQDIRHLAFQLRDVLTGGPVTSPNSAQDLMRQQAFELLEHLALNATTTLLTIAPGLQAPQDELERARSLAEIVESIAAQIYFASGAYNAVDQDTAIRVRFLKEVDPLFNILTNIGMPAIAHHLLQTLEYFIPIDPAGVFLRIGNVVLAAAPYGYQFESQAAKLLSSLVERYLAEYRSIFRKNADCRQMLLNILDILVGADWPEARRLIYRTHEVFR